MGSFQHAHKQPPEPPQSARMGHLHSKKIQRCYLLQHCISNGQRESQSTQSGMFTASCAKHRCINGRERCTCTLGSTTYHFQHRLAGSRHGHPATKHGMIPPIPEGGLHKLCLCCLSLGCFDRAWTAANIVEAWNVHTSPEFWSLPQEGTQSGGTGSQMELHCRMCPRAESSTIT